MKKNLLLVAALVLSCLGIHAQAWEEPVAPQIQVEMPESAAELGDPAELKPGNVYLVAIKHAVETNIEGACFLANSGANNGFTQWASHTGLVKMESAIKYEVDCDSKGNWTFRNIDGGKYTFRSGSLNNQNTRHEMHVDKGSQAMTTAYFNVVAQGGNVYRIGETEDDPTFGKKANDKFDQEWWGYAPTSAKPIAVGAAYNPADEEVYCDWVFYYLAKGGTQAYGVRQNLYKKYQEYAEKGYTFDISAYKALYDDEDATAAQLEKAVADFTQDLKDAAIKEMEKATEENPYDCTSLIENYNFEAGNINGWICTFKSGVHAQNIGYQSNNVYTNELVEAYENHLGEAKQPELNKFIEAWASNDVKYQVNHKFGHVGDGELKQIMVNLPAGKYKLSADCMARQQHNAEAQAAGVQGVHLYATGGGVDNYITMATPEYTTPNTNNRPLHFDLVFASAGGDIEIGLRTRNSTANWIAADNFELVYYGPMSEEEAAKFALAEKIKRVEAQYDLPNIKANKDVKADFTATLTEAKAATSDFKAESEKIDQAITKLESSEQAYVSLNNAITEAGKISARYKGTNWNELSEELNDMIDRMQNAYTRGNYTDEQALSAMDEVNTFVVEYIVSHCQKGDDISALLKNPSFDDGTTEGWTTKETFGYANATTQGKNKFGSMVGEACPDYDKYQEAVENDGFTGTLEEFLATYWGRNCEMYKKTFDIRQTIKNLPKGAYKFSCQGFYRNDGANGDPKPYLFAVVKDSTNIQTAPFAEIFGNMSEESLFAPDADGDPGSWNNDHLRDGKYYPNTMSGAMYHFHHKNDGVNYDYTSSLIINLSEACDIIVGATAKTGDYWVIFDNFTITYMGSGKDVYADLIQELEDEGDEIVADATNEAYYKWVELKDRADKALKDDNEPEYLAATQYLADGIEELRASVKKVTALRDRAEYYKENRVPTIDNETAAVQYEEYLDGVLKHIDYEGVEDDAEIEAIYAEMDVEAQKAAALVIEEGDYNEFDPCDLNAMITNNDYTFYSSEATAANTSGWTIQGSTGGYCGEFGTSVEFYGGFAQNRTGKTNFSQMLTNLVPGYYRLKVNAFYRDGNAAQLGAASKGVETEITAEKTEAHTADKGTWYEAITSVTKEGDVEKIDTIGYKKHWFGEENAVLYAGEAATNVLSILDKESLDTYMETFGEEGAECTYVNEEGEEVTVHIPNNMGQSTAAFSDGLWENILQFEISEEAEVKAFAEGVKTGASIEFGIKHQGAVRPRATDDSDGAQTNWLMIGNWQLEYIGTNEPSEDPTTEIKNAPAALISTAIYSINGVQQSRLQKGVNIVKAARADGSTKMVKVLVK